MNPPAPSPAPGPDPGGPPPSCKKWSQGCASLMVFLLAVVCAGSLVVLYSGWAVRNTGRVVVEFLEQNSPEEMEAHQRMAVSGTVVDAAIKRINLDPAGHRAGGPNYEVRDRILKNLQVDIDGRFLTFTVDQREKEPAALASAMAEALDEDMINVREEYDRRISQNLEAQIKNTMESAEKARLEWMDVMKKMDVSPAKVAAEEAGEAEMRARLAKARGDLIVLEARLSVSKDGDEAKAPLIAEHAALKAATAEYQKQVQAGTEQAAARMHRLSECEVMKKRHEEQVALLHKLRVTRMDSRVAEGVVKRPTRIVEYARVIQAPDSRFRRNLGMAAVISGVLLAASLLASVTRFLRRH